METKQCKPSMRCRRRGNISRGKRDGMSEGGWRGRQIGVQDKYRWRLLKKRNAVALCTVFLVNFQNSRSL